MQSTLTCEFLAVGQITKFGVIGMIRSPNAEMMTRMDGGFNEIWRRTLKIKI